MSQGSFILWLQRLPSAMNRVLVLGHIAGIRNGDAWFTPAEVAATFEDYRLPVPSNINATLGRLRERERVIHHSAKPSWSLTPEGREEVRKLLEGADVAAIDVEVSGYPGADFAHVRHTVLPPELAPPRWSKGIASLLERFPFESNVFCMTRFPKSRNESIISDPVQGAIEIIRGTLSLHGLVLHLASDRQIDDDLLGNIGAHMWACQYGIGLLENHAGNGLNYNVILELGAMLMTGRRCAMLKDKSAPRLPTDLAGQIYKSVDFVDLADVAEKVHAWVAHDLGLGKCPQCPTDPHDTDASDAAA